MAAQRGTTRIVKSGKIRIKGRVSGQESCRKLESIGYMFVADSMVSRTFIKRITQCL